MTDGGRQRPSRNRMGIEMRNVLIVCCIALSLFLVWSCSGQADQSWQAQWIGLDDASAVNTWTCFRKQFELTESPAAAVARIACDSKYWLWINGELVVFEGQLKRGPTPRDTYYDAVDLAPHLKKGTNTIAVLVWPIFYSWAHDLGRFVT